MLLGELGPSSPGGRNIPFVVKGRGLHEERGRVELSREHYHHEQHA